MKPCLIVWLLMLSLVSLGRPGYAAEEPAEGATVPPAYRALPESSASTVESVQIAGRTVWYRAEAGTIAISEDERKPAARLFYISYTRLAGDDGEPMPAADRPITFSFNGGPGSSSVWLHLGVFGPLRVGYADEAGHPPPPPYGLVPNASSLLDVSDFVFIDPVSTGFSRPEEDVNPKDYHGVEADIESVGRFIQQYLSRHERWTSPKFIAGESYGTTRAAGLSQHLWSRHGIGLNGVMLISTVLNFQTLRFNDGNDLPCILFLPNFAATAWYHNALDADLQAMGVEELIEEVTEFATGPYATYLLRNADADQGLRDEVRVKLARYTGLTEAYIERADYRVSMPEFCKELLRDRGETVGRLDSRFVGFDRDGKSSSYEFDPSYSAILGSYTAGLNHLVRERIGFETDLPYEILTGRVRPWEYGGAGNNRYVDVAERLRNAMAQQPHLHVYNAAGIYDLATTSAAAEYTLARVFSDPRVRERIMHRRYEAGHMMYLHAESLRKMREDLVAFYELAID